MKNKQIHIIGGGTFSYVRTHLALAAPAFGETAKHLFALCVKRFEKMDTSLHLTKMADYTLSESVEEIDIRNDLFIKKII